MADLRKIRLMICSLLSLWSVLVIMTVDIELMHIRWKDPPPHTRPPYFPPTLPPTVWGPLVCSGGLDIVLLL